MGRLVVFGAGELGGRVAHRWRVDGGEVLAVTQSERRHAALRAAGIEPVAGTGAGAGLPVARLRPDDVLVLALPGTAAQHDAIRALDHVAAPARTVLVSSTGYHAGSRGTQDESSGPGPHARARRIADCERAFAEWARERGVVLRCGGLYRPGRGPAAFVARRVVDGKWSGALPGAGDETLALVHYDDAAASVLAALQHSAPERVYVCVTPPSPSRRAFYAAVAGALGTGALGTAALGIDAPAFAQPDVGGARRAFDVALLARDLLPTPGHPDWREATRG